MAGPRHTKKALTEHELAPKKRFGQNFLVHERTAENIVHAGHIESDDVVIEVGVGLGALTHPLAKKARHVYGLEIDSGIIRYHQDEADLPENVTLIHQDVLKADFDELAEKCGGTIKIMANLPYSISNPFLFKLIENRHHLQWATIMLQKEVADRLVAAPGTKQYGIPTILLGCCAQITQLLTLKPAEFHPRPKIDSVVIRIDFTRPHESSHLLDESDWKLFRTIVRAAFGQRRKTLANTLSSAQLFMTEAKPIDKKTNKELTEATITSCEMSPKCRAETLTLEQYIQLTLTFSKAITRHLGR